MASLKYFSLLIFRGFSAVLAARIIIERKARRENTINSGTVQ
jgi:hypothetical protein